MNDEATWEHPFYQGDFLERHIVTWGDDRTMTLKDARLVARASDPNSDINIYQSRTQMWLWRTPERYVTEIIVYLPTETKRAMRAGNNAYNMIMSLSRAKNRLELSYIAYRLLIQAAAYDTQILQALYPIINHADQG